MRDGGVVVVGGSTAGLAAARELRDLGYEGTLTVINEEAEIGYQRPPLSKRGLHEEAPLGGSLADLGLTVVVGRATALKGSVVSLADGTGVGFDQLVVATGARPRRLAAPAQLGEHVLRDLDDARELRTALDSAATAVVVGAGFLGMEVASACLARGLHVTVVDVDAPLERLLGSYVSQLVQARLREAGGCFRRGRASLVGDPVHGVCIDDREELLADVVVTCVGDVPNVEWLSGSGVEVADGVVVDERGRTTLPSVLAAGDVACAPRAGRVVRRPFWSNAVAQGRQVARTILERDPGAGAWDDYLWTEVTGLAVKVVGPVPVVGPPDVVDGSLDGDAGALLRWDGSDGPTVVSWGRRMSAVRLRALTG